MNDNAAELAQAKDDLAKLLEAAKIYDARYKGADFRAVTGIIEAKIARLEAELADPWRRAKEYFDRQRARAKGDDIRMLPLSDEAKHALAYYDHLTAENERLTARVTELEAELSTLPPSCSKRRMP